MKVSDFLKMLYFDGHMVRLLEYDDGNGEEKELFHGEALHALKSEYSCLTIENFIPGDVLTIYLE